MAAKVYLYHSPTGVARPLVLLKQNDDGTLDLGDDKGVLDIGKCPVSDVPRVGFCTPAEASALEGGKTQDDELDSKTKKELLEIVEQLNAEPRRPRKIELIGNENKTALLAAIRSLLAEALLPETNDEPDPATLVQ